MPNKETVLIIEDDRELALLLQEVLAEEGFSPSWTADGVAGLQEANTQKPSLVLLDINLPAMSGLEVCRTLKNQEHTKAIPIIMLTGRISETDVVLGLELGAEDYIPKPFRPKELGARIRAVLRRTRIAPPEQKNMITLGPISMDSTRHETKLEGQLLALTLTEFRLLWLLASNAGKVFTREQLLERISNGDFQIVDRNIDVHIGSLRKKLGAHATLIITVRGIGYKCRDDVSSASGNQPTAAA